ncbi:hypothetical protein Aci011_064 [Acinetobacter phage vB_AbaM_B09_Aci01-1]|uniref:DUF2493 domain-containing protein n=2 Tax=Saclayvirus TaxID=2733128 RepID=A0A386KAH7_9CAUD|nr:GTP-binding domain [Acinetobacter phage vB_AbaM_B09_Aci01-1]YP_009813917.1 GTP-binding domain [Acinetobacter phage vB_AbaM_B09_Aci05]AYD82388.1 hypothetical protein Aci05_063 [Acinetobacter phage vB_AbaM_B09_Aci05]AYD85603.1 hypothetical protein Aci011_064 [Acinetobacter phage vB_AbaM_B09_Aci01-1]
MKHVALLITGSREGWTYEEFEELMLERHDPKDIGIMIFGCARGIDSFAKTFCLKNGIYFHEFKADWDNEGKKAGILRNECMAKFLEMKSHSFAVSEVIAFRYDLSRGTTHMIKYSQDMGFNILVHDKSSFTFG